MATWAANTVRVSPYRSRIDRWFSSNDRCSCACNCSCGLRAIHRAPCRPARSYLGVGGRTRESSFLPGLFSFKFKACWLLTPAHVRLHRRLGLASAGLLVLMIPLGYFATIGMVRRGFDLAGDQHIDADPILYSVFSFGSLALFSVLATAALLYRRRPEIHKRTDSVCEHYARASSCGPPPGPLPRSFRASLPFRRPHPHSHPLALFFSKRVPRRWTSSSAYRKIALVIFVSLPLMAGVIGPSAVWHRLAGWITGR